MSVLIIAEHDNRTLKLATKNVITAGLQLANQVDVLVAGFQCDTVVDELKQCHGVNVIKQCDDEVLAHPTAENLEPIITAQASQYTHLLAPATTFGKNVMPRVAAKLDVGQVSDVIEILDSDTYKRPIYAGNVIATVKSLDPIKILTIRPTAFAAVSQTASDVKCQKLNSIKNSSSSKFVKAELHGSERPELTAAEIVISGGRGLADKENFAKLARLADRLGAAVGASRAAVDAGLAPNDFQVGQTGKVVAPKLYIAIGISGAIQHIAGMKDSRVIVAINKDPDAPIFQFADYGLVADVKEVLEKWEALLGEYGY